MGNHHYNRIRTLNPCVPSIKTNVTNHASNDLIMHIIIELKNVPKTAHSSSSA